MATYTKRVQSVLTEEQYNKLTHLAAEQSKPVSLLIREAVDFMYFAKAERQRRRAALDRILSLDAPAADWEQMESEIIEGAIGD
ncbi:MAG: hypothetical protein KKD28_13250 [Chloroflexi bacterium]|nr:hypothetical protein [Chloroflexota bacterium]MBU1662427.1 hypothetical protein [Chloroflexota bacterium]